MALRSQRILTSITEAIGQTPLVELDRLTQDMPGRILAKVEYLNPGYSKKDRIGLQMIEDAEKDGTLRPGQTVVELTSGNTPPVDPRSFIDVEERGAFRADQFALEGNLRAHYLHTGPEILEQTGGAIHAFCDFVGSGGTFAGCAAAFKEHDPAIACYVVEPQGAAILAGHQALQNPVQ